MITTSLPEGPNGRVHYGATTQDKACRIETQNNLSRKRKG
jgi:hypothetical protein